MGSDEQDEARDEEPQEHHGAREPDDPPGQEATELDAEEVAHPAT